MNLSYKVLYTEYLSVNTRHLQWKNPTMSLQRLNPRLRSPHSSLPWFSHGARGCICVLHYKYRNCFVSEGSGVTHPLIDCLPWKNIREAGWQMVIKAARDEVFGMKIHRSHQPKSGRHAWSGENPEFWYVQGHFTHCNWWIRKEKEEIQTVTPSRLKPPRSFCSCHVFCILWRKASLTNTGKHVGSLVTSHHRISGYWSSHFFQLPLTAVQSCAALKIRYESLWHWHWRGGDGVIVHIQVLLTQTQYLT